MLTVFAQAGQPLMPSDVWTTWNLDVSLFVGLVGVAWAYRRGRTSAQRNRLRDRAFAGGLVVLFVALISPLEAMSSALASAHMVQHVLLILVAAPLLAFSAPSSTLLRAMPRRLASTGGRWRRRVRVAPTVRRVLRTPVVVWLLYVGAIWSWHSAALYDAAAGNEFLHSLEHLSFLGTAWLFWSVVIGTRRKSSRAHGQGVLLVFAVTIPSIYLSLLMTFANAPWYDSYLATAPRWGLDPLADQQLAGAIMWIPSNLVYVLVALALFVSWIRSTEDDTTIRSAASPRGHTGTARRPSWPTRRR